MVLVSRCTLVAGRARLKREHRSLGCGAALRSSVVSVVFKSYTYMNRLVADITARVRVWYFQERDESGRHINLNISECASLSTEPTAFEKRINCSAIV